MNLSSTMRGLVRLAVMAGLTVISFTAAMAQAGTGIPQSPPAKIEGKFSIAHFDRDDRTVVALAHQKVGGDAACGIFVSAGYSYVGKPTAPDRVFISFVRDSADEPKLLKSDAERTLIFAVDGETLTLGPMPSVKEVVTGYSLTTQGLLLPIPTSTFNRIANAKKVDVHLGPLAFSLTSQNLQDFRDLARRMTTTQ